MLSFTSETPECESITFPLASFIFFTQTPCLKRNLFSGLKTVPPATNTPDSRRKQTVAKRRSYAHLPVVNPNIQCWCGADTDLTKNGEELPSEKCDMLCAGTTVGEHCGGNNTMTAYEIELGAPSVSEYIGCYADAPIRAMDAEEVHLTGNMTNLVSSSNNPAHRNILLLARF